MIPMTTLLFILWNILIIFTEIKMMEDFIFGQIVFLILKRFCLSILDKIVIQKNSSFDVFRSIISAIVQENLTNVRGDHFDFFCHCAYCNCFKSFSSRISFANSCQKQIFTFQIFASYNLDCFYRKQLDLSIH